jgi:NodT family efflux transporter outer membrane factor (OMF) lipoprotein
MFAAAALLGSCAVGPDFKKPAPPPVTGYTPAPVSTTSSSTNVVGGEAQRFVSGQDIVGDWWTLFHSPALNALIERSLKANPNLKAAQAALLMARENVKAQYGAYYPTASASFSGSREHTASTLSPVPNSSEFVFDLYTPQVTVSYVPDVFGLNRRTVESLKAQEQQARFAWMASDIALTANVVAAAIQEASLRAQIDATHRLVDLNNDMLRILRNQLTKGYASRLDVAAQEAQLAQMNATLPPLLKQLDQNRDLMAALSGGFPSEGLAEKFEMSSLQLPRDLPLSLPSRLVEQRPDVRQAEENMHCRGQSLAEFYLDCGCRFRRLAFGADVLFRHGFLGVGGVRDAAHFRRRNSSASPAGGPSGLHPGCRAISQHGPFGLSERGRHPGGAQTGCRCIECGLCRQ